MRDFAIPFELGVIASCAVLVFGYTQTQSIEPNSFAQRLKISHRYTGRISPTKENDVHKLSR